MARAPAAAADDDMMMMDKGAGAPTDAMPAESEAEPASTVVVSILKNEDGTYQVVAGPPPAGDTAEEPVEEQSFDGIGAALHRAMEILQDDAQGADGQGGAQAQFEAGFGEGAGPKGM